MIKYNQLNPKSKIRINLQKFREIYDLYYEPLCKFLLFYTKDAHIIEDIVQEVFLALWENRDSIEISYIKTYLFQSAKNKLLNYLRDEENRSALLEKWYREQLESRIPAEERFNTDALLKIIDKAIESLPEKCREIFILSKVENLSYKQIAELQQISLKTVENQMGIALKKIREYLALNYPSTVILLLPLFF